MKNKFLLLAPVLVSVAGCTEKIDAHESDRAPNEIGITPGQNETFVEYPEDQELDLEPRSPQDLD